MARRCWFIRAGERGQFALAFEASRTVGMAGDDEARLVKFREEIRVGDLVVTADLPARQLLVGEVVGDVEARKDEGTGGGQHVRTVDWYGRYNQSDRSILSEPMARLTVEPASLVELSPTDGWLSFADRLRERPTLARATPMTAPPPPKPRATRASTAAAKAALAAKPPPPPTHVLCPMCGLQKIKSQFRAGSAHCIDCRERMGED